MLSVDMVGAEKVSCMVGSFAKSPGLGTLSAWQRYPIRLSRPEISVLKALDFSIRSERRGGVLVRQLLISLFISMSYGRIYLCAFQLFSSLRSRF